MSANLPGGWTASGVYAGIKADGSSDLALLVSDRPATVAAAFTTNKAVCAHIEVCRPRVSRGMARGVVVTSGNANAATGPAGVAHATELAASAASACGVPSDDMLVCSTGKIGLPLPMPAIEAAMSKAAAALRPDGLADAARAIWTTDTKLKVAERSADGVRVTGFAKGAAMIAPDMVPHATMLAFLASDAEAPPDELRAALADGLPTTFNAITVDGSTSTNDTVLLFANGSAGTPAGAGFAAAVREVMAELAYAIVSDGEGATRVIRIRITGARDGGQARAGAKEVANSILLRSVIWGGEAKWGWVVQQLGQAPIDFDQSLTRVSICGVELAVGGVATGRQREADAKLDVPEVVIEADLGLGGGSFEYLTCDITPNFPKMQLAT